MNLYATVTSERGKPATKGGQEWLRVELEAGGLKVLRLTIDERGVITIRDKDFMPVRVWEVTNMLLKDVTDEPPRKTGGICYQEHTRGKYGGVTGKHIHD